MSLQNDVKQTSLYEELYSVACFANSMRRGIIYLKSVNCTFCSLIKNLDNDLIIFEDNFTIAFLDRRPLFKGHTLLIPKSHFETLSELPDELVSKVFTNVKTIDIAVQKATHSEGSFVAINNKISQSIPHLHIHIVPRKHKDGLRGFFWPRIIYETELEEKNMALKIKNEIQFLIGDE